MLHSLLHSIKHLACVADIGRAAGVNGVLNICIVAQDCDVVSPLCLLTPVKFRFMLVTYNRVGGGGGCQ